MKTKAPVWMLMLVALSALVSCKKAPEEAQQPGKAAQVPAEQRVERNPDRNAYFGETHIHTSWSVDAWLFGNHLTGPNEALKYGNSGRRKRWSSAGHGISCAIATLLG